MGFASPCGVFVFFFSRGASRASVLGNALLRQFPKRETSQHNSTATTLLCSLRFPSFPFFVSVYLLSNWEAAIAGCEMGSRGGASVYIRQTRVASSLVVLTSVF